MYLDFFGLRELPFNNTPDPRFFFPTPDHEEALASLIYAVQARKGFVLLTGEIGAGKTLVSRLMLRRIGSNIAFANINHAVQSAHDLMEAVCNEFELKIAVGTTHAQLVRILHDFLLMRFAQNIPVVLVLDEAQNLPNDAFEQLRMIGNLEADDAKLLQICIVGQPELQARFAAPDLRQLRQRLFRSFHLPALNRTCTEGYMRHRITVSGGKIETIFSDEAIDEVFRLSRGLPRLINTICDNAMLSAYAADQRLIDDQFVRTVSAQMMLIEPDDEQPRSADTADVEWVSHSRSSSIDASGKQNDTSRSNPPCAAPDDTLAAIGRPRLNRPDARPVTTPASVPARSKNTRPAENVASLMRTDLGRLRSDMATLMGQTSRRMGAIERQLSARAAGPDSARLSSATLSPILIRAAAIIERAERANRPSPLCSSTAKSAFETGNSSSLTEDSTALGSTSRVGPPSSDDVDALVKRLDADARTADSMLRAWQRSEAKSRSNAPSGDGGSIVARWERVVNATPNAG